MINDTYLVNEMKCLSFMLHYHLLNLFMVVISFEGRQKKNYCVEQIVH